MAGNVFSWLSAEVKMAMNDDTDTHEAAKLLMDGCNMGIQSISEYVNDNPGASSTSKELASQLIASEEELMRELKVYL